MQAAGAGDRATMVKSAGYSTKGPGSSFQLLHGSPSSLTPVPGDLIPPAGLQGHQAFMQCIGKMSIYIK